MYKHKSFTILLIMPLIFIATVFTVSCSQSKEPARLSSNQSDYPILSDVNGFLSFVRIDSMEMLNSYADIVIKGSIANVLPKIIKKFVPDPDSAEAQIMKKTGQKELIAETFPIKINVEDVIRGDSEITQTQITLYLSSNIIDGCPKFKTGDVFIFFLSKKITLDGYVPVGPHDGFYYYAFDNKVYPAAVNEELEYTSGMDYESFKELILDSVAE